MTKETKMIEIDMAEVYGVAPMRDTFTTLVGNGWHHAANGLFLDCLAELRDGWRRNGQDLSYGGHSRMVRWMIQTAKDAGTWNAGDDLETVLLNWLYTEPGHEQRLWKREFADVLATETAAV